MRKYILNTVIVVSFLYSCNISSGNSEMSAAEKERLTDSLKNEIQKDIDSSITTHMLDTSGLFSSPITIISASVNRRNVYLKWKNVSNKPVSAVRFKWYGLNAFGEPADMGSNYYSGFGGGFSDDEVAPGKVDQGEWSILSRDAKKLVLAWPTEVAFKDGSKWILKN